MESDDRSDIYQVGILKSGVGGLSRSIVHHVITISGVILIRLRIVATVIAIVVVVTKFLLG